RKRPAVARTLAQSRKSACCCFVFSCALLRVGGYGLVVHQPQTTAIDHSDQNSHSVVTTKLRLYVLRDEGGWRRFRVHLFRLLESWRFDQSPTPDHTTELGCATLYCDLDPESRWCPFAIGRTALVLRHHSVDRRSTLSEDESCAVTSTR